MDWNEFVYQCWGDHAHNAALVGERIKEKSRELKEPAILNTFVPLLVHVYGEHLGDWQHGIDILKSFSSLANTEELKALLKRSEAILSLGINPTTSMAEFSISEQTRIFATVSSAFLGHEKTELAVQFLTKALSSANQLGPKDPAVRSLAVSTNGMASALEMRETLTTAEVDLMLECAQAARTYWELAGTWKEVERAEYRLSFCHLKAKMATEALKHAELCLHIVEQNGADFFEKFFAHEALAMSQFSLGQLEKAKKEVMVAEELFGKIEAGSRQWCQESLAKLKKLVV